MSKQTYHPDRGDIIHVSFSPSAGTELTGPHFGLVLSTIRFSRATGLCIVLPLTTKYHAEQKLRDTHLMLKMPKLANLDQEGWVYIHQIKTIDYRERGASYKSEIDEENLGFLIDVMERVRALIDPDTV